MLQKKHSKYNSILFFFLVILFLHTCNGNSQDSIKQTSILKPEQKALDSTLSEVSPQQISTPNLSEQVPRLYSTIAASGLIVRAEPGINSTRIGKIPYGSIVELLEETEVRFSTIENGDTIKGFWVKIKFNNVPFRVLDPGINKFKEEGYVFSGFIEKLHKANIEITKIDSLKFYELYQVPSSSNLKKITSQKEVEGLLTSKVKWKESEMVEGRMVDKVILNNKHVLHFLPDDLSFIAYYPSEEIILFEGGHSSDFSISIKTGESLETVGNPDYIIESPNKAFRLNGWFSGHECSSYFFQKKSGDKHVYLTDFGLESEKHGLDICYFNKFCWLDDGTFIFSFTNSSIQEYYLGQLDYE